MINNVSASVIPYVPTYDLTLSNNSGWSKSGRNYVKDISNNSYGWQDNFIELPTTLKTNINTYDFTYINASLIYTIGTDTLILNNVDFDTTCSSGHLENMAPTMTITYSDGSRSQIAGSTYEYICDSYHIQHNNNNITITETNRDKSPYFNILVRKNGQNITCEPLGQSLYKCPKYNIDDINGSQYFIFNTYFNGSGGNYRIYLYEYLYFDNKDSTDIINNQNQIANQQHNDSNAINNNITNTYNFISSDTIESTTNTDDITSQYDSTSNNNVLNFMLIPINFVNSIITGFGNSCSQVCLGNCSSGGFHDDFNFTFVMPCIDIKSVIGNDIYNTIDSLMCVAMIFAFIRSVVGFAKRALLLEADVSSEVRVF